MSFEKTTYSVGEDGKSVEVTLTVDKNVHFEHTVEVVPRAGSAISMLHTTTYLL